MNKPSNDLSDKKNERLAKQAQAKKDKALKAAQKAAQKLNNSKNKTKKSTKKGKDDKKEKSDPAAPEASVVQDKTKGIGKAAEEEEKGLGGLGGLLAKKQAYPGMDLGPSDYHNNHSNPSYDSAGYGHGSLGSLSESGHPMAGLGHMGQSQHPHTQHELDKQERERQQREQREKDQADVLALEAYQQSLDHNQHQQYGDGIGGYSASHSHGMGLGGMSKLDALSGIGEHMGLEGLGGGIGEMGEFEASGHTHGMANMAGLDVESGLHDLSDGNMMSSHLGGIGEATHNTHDHELNRIGEDTHMALHTGLGSLGEGDDDFEV